MKANKKEVLTSDKKGLKKLAPKQLQSVKGGIMVIIEDVVM